MIINWTENNISGSKNNINATNNMFSPTDFPAFWP